MASQPRPHDQRAPLQLDIWREALEKYQERTETDLQSETDELSRRLTAAATEGNILEILEEKLQAFSAFRQGSVNQGKIRARFKTVVHVVLLFNDAIAEGASSARLPGGKTILVAVGVLLKASQDVSERFDIISELFEKLDYFLKRVQSRGQVPFSEGSRAIAVQILVELLNIFALTTKAMKRTRLRHYSDVFFKKDKIREALHTLDFLTSQELSANVVENMDLTYQVLRMQREFRTAMLEHSRHITSQHNQILTQVSTIREFIDFLYEGLSSLRPSRRVTLEYSTTTPAIIPAVDSRTDHSHEFIGQALQAALQGDRHATLLCFTLFASGYLDLGSSVQIKIPTTHFVLLLLALWRALCWLQRNIPASIKHDPSNLITLIDLLGTKISLSAELCLTPNELHATLCVYFKSRKCRWFVEHHLYELTKNGDSSTITQENWKDMVFCGVEIVMNAVFSVSSRNPGGVVTCPSCQAEYADRSTEYYATWMTCTCCSHEFKISGIAPAPIKGIGSANTSISSSPSAAPTNRSFTPPMPNDDLKYCRRTRIGVSRELIKAKLPRERFSRLRSYRIRARLSRSPSPVPPR